MNQRLTYCELDAKALLNFANRFPEQQQQHQLEQRVVRGGVCRSA